VFFFTNTVSKLFKKKLFCLHIKWLLRRNSIKIDSNVNIKETEKRLFSNSKFVETLLICFHDKIIFRTMGDPSRTQALTYLQYVTFKRRKILPDYL